jgi:hypothetical protein
MKLGELFKIGERIHNGEEGVTPPHDTAPAGAGLSVFEFNINRVDNNTTKYEIMIPNLNKKYLDCGIITRDPKYWRLTPKTRRKRIDENFYISLMKFNEGLKENSNKISA